MTTNSSRVESWLDVSRKELKLFGWRVVKGMDMCSLCVEERKPRE